MELYVNGKLEDVAWGVTNRINGIIILVPRVIDGIEVNSTAASTVLHERKHFFNFKAGIYQGNSYINNQ
jgi:hypothetical protein